MLLYCFIDFISLEINLLTHDSNQIKCQLGIEFIQEIFKLLLLSETSICYKNFRQIAFNHNSTSYLRITDMDLAIFWFVGVEFFATSTHKILTLNEKL